MTPSIRCVIAVFASLSAIQMAGAQVGSPIHMRLTPGSTLTHEYCLPPCACPAGTATGPLVGGLVLVPEVLMPPAYFRYSIAQVHWTGQAPRADATFIGTGVYEVFGDFVFQQRTQLDLSANGQASEHFDTGVVFTGPMTAQGPQVGCRRFTLTFDWVERCVADYNADGSVDPDDLSDFITGFFTAPPDARADFNLDGSTDPDDLSDFITSFFTAC